MKKVMDLTIKLVEKVTDDASCIYSCSCQHQSWSACPGGYWAKTDATNRTIVYKNETERNTN